MLHLNSSKYKGCLVLTVEIVVLEHIFDLDS